MAWKRLYLWKVVFGSADKLREGFNERTEFEGRSMAFQVMGFIDWVFVKYKLSIGSAEQNIISGSAVFVTVRRSGLQRWSPILFA